MYTTPLKERREQSDSDVSSVEAIAFSPSRRHSRSQISLQRFLRILGQISRHAQIKKRCLVFVGKLFVRFFTTSLLLQVSECETNFETNFWDLIWIQIFGAEGFTTQDTSGRPCRLRASWANQGNRWQARGFEKSEFNMKTNENIVSLQSWFHCSCFFSWLFTNVYHVIYICIKYHWISLYETL